MQWIRASLVAHLYLLYEDTRIRYSTLLYYYSTTIMLVLYLKGTQSRGLDFSYESPIAELLSKYQEAEGKEIKSEIENASCYAFSDANWADAEGAAPRAGASRGSRPTEGLPLRAVSRRNPVGFAAAWRGAGLRRRAVLSRSCGRCWFSRP